MSISKLRLQAMEQKFIQEQFEQVPFMIERGTCPVIVSAPHSVPQLRLGKPKVGEFLTGVLVQLLHEQTNCFAAYKTKNVNDDANFDQQNPYKDALVHCIQTEKIHYLLDIHIMSSKRQAAVEIGTGKGKNILSDFSVDELLQLFHQYQIKPVIVDQLFTAGNPNTVSSTIAKNCGINAIQIEINWRLLDLSQNGQSFLNVLACLQAIIKHLTTKGISSNA